MAIKKQKWMIVMGTRPEVIKMAPVLFAARKMPGVQALCVCTGQHRELSTTALGDFAITPDFNLDVMQQNQDLGSLTARILESMKTLLAAEQPDAIFVQGDTTTSFASALAAFYARIPVYHVEAGLRSNDLASPFPEEGNRQLTARLTKLHFAPTPGARANLCSEGIAETAIHITGNTVVDALHWMVNKLSLGVPNAAEKLGSFHAHLQHNAPFVLVTAHRRENFGDGFIHLCQALRRLAQAYPATHFVFPVHLNPNVRGPVFKLLHGIPNVHLLEPLDYRTFIWLMHRASFLISDSGGIQEEAVTLGKPLLIMRDNTERMEAVDAHCAILTGMKEETIVAMAGRLIDDRAFYHSYTKGQNVYGDGRAGERIVHAVYADLVNTVETTVSHPILVAIRTARTRRAGLVPPPPVTFHKHPEATAYASSPA